MPVRSYSPELFSIVGFVEVCCLCAILSVDNAIVLLPIATRVFEQDDRTVHQAETENVPGPGNRVRPLGVIDMLEPEKWLHHHYRNSYKKCLGDRRANAGTRHVEKISQQTLVLEIAYSKEEIS